VTAEVTPHHLLLTDETARTYDPVYKVNPPLRTQADVEALRTALADGTIDIVATDHAPHPTEDKECEWSAAAFGMVGLETALAIVSTTMVASGRMSWADVARVMSTTPAHIGRVSNHGRIEIGAEANLVLVDPSTKTVVSKADTASKSHNNPFDGIELTGQVVETFLRGASTYRRTS